MKTRFFVLGMFILLLFVGTQRSQAESFQTPCDKRDPNIILCHAIVMENGTYHVYTKKDAPPLIEMLKRLRKHPEYFLVVNGGFSNVDWVSIESDEVENALDGGLAMGRGADGIDFLLGKYIGMTRSERNMFVKYLPGNNQTNEATPRPVTTFELTRHSHMEDFIDQRADQRIEDWASKQNLQSPPTFFQIRTKNGQLGELSEDGMTQLEGIIDHANAPNEALVVWIPETEPELEDVVRKRLGEWGLEDDPTVAWYQLAEGQTDIPVQLMLQPVDGDVSHIENKGDEQPSNPTEKPVEDPSDTKWEFVVGGTLHMMTGWDDHLSDRIDSTGPISTPELQLLFNQRVGMTCRFQLPGSFFEKEGAEKLSIAEIQATVRVLGPICATASWSNFASVNEEHIPSRPDLSLEYREQYKNAWTLGLEAEVFNFKKKHRVCVGAKCLWLDREYEVPPRWTFKQAKDTALQVYAGYGYSFFSF